MAGVKPNTPYKVTMKDKTIGYGNWDGEGFNIDGLHIATSAIDDVEPVGRVVRPPGSFSGAALAAFRQENGRDPTLAELGKIVGIVQPPLAMALRGVDIASKEADIPLKQDAALDREIKQYGTPYQKAVDIGAAHLEKIDNDLVMLNQPGAVGKTLAVPGMLTALISGQGTGIRVTMPELNMILHARGIAGSADAFFNKIKGEGPLAGDQAQQMKAILGDIRSRVILKQNIHRQALDEIGKARDRSGVLAAKQKAEEKLRAVENNTYKSQVNRNTGERRYSLDGGKTWQTEQQ
jgi:hypothetical protein